MNKLNQYIVIFLTLIIVNGCGSGKVDDSLSAKEKIEIFAQKGAEPPSVQDYLDAGITNINNENIDEVNRIVASLPAGNDYSIEEIKETLDEKLGLYADIVNPIITLKGESIVTLIKGQDYIEAGFIASDDRDGDITDKVKTIGTVDSNKVGSYTLSYSVSDSTGNEIIVGRTVNVSESADIVNPINGININEVEHVSLTVGIKQKLYFANNQEVKWVSSSPEVTVDKEGNIYAKEDKYKEKARATITAIPDNGDKNATCNVTIVNWRANLSSLDIKSSPLKVDALLTHKNTSTYYVHESKVYISDDSMVSSTELEKFDVGSYRGNKRPYVLEAGNNYYIRVGERIHETKDFTDYKEVLTNTSNGFACRHVGLKSGFTFNNKNNYMYAAEYSVDPNNTHSIFRGKIKDTGVEDWKKVLNFDSITQKTIKSIRHIHVVAVDEYTGNVWVGTGDDSHESRLYYSEDYGSTFKLFAMGSQYYRTLAIWFTKDYIYWNTDSTAPSVKQVISRVPRTKVAKQILTPVIKSGKTKIGALYYIIKSDGLLGKKGRLYREHKERTLDANNTVYAVHDPIYDYREVVAELANTAHWYHLKVKDKQGDEIVIMSTAAEKVPKYERDHRPRIFGIKEKEDGTVDVQELLSIKNIYGEDYMQLIPEFQDEEGYIYFIGNHTEDSVYKAKLQWNNQ